MSTQIGELRCGRDDDMCKRTTLEVSREANGLVLLRIIHRCDGIELGQVTYGAATALAVAEEIMKVAGP